MAHNFGSGLPMRRSVVAMAPQSPECRSASSLMTTIRVAPRNAAVRRAFPRSVEPPGRVSSSRSNARWQRVRDHDFQSPSEAISSTVLSNSHTRIRQSGGTLAKTKLASRWAAFQPPPSPMLKERSITTAKCSAGASVANQPADRPPAVSTVGLLTSFWPRPALLDPRKLRSIFRTGSTCFVSTETIANGLS